MKLLKKNEASKEIVLARKMQTDEGLAIATKIDSLRASLNDLEVQHLHFAQNKETELQQRLGGLTKQIKELKAEITLLESKRIELLKPLDAEWSVLKEERKNLTLEKSEFDTKYLALQEATVEVNNKNIDLDSQMAIFIHRIKETDATNRKAKDNLDKSVLILKSAQEDKSCIEEYTAQKKSALLTREANIASKEREQSIEKARISQEWDRINKQTILLVDREATLDREIKRQNK